MQCNNCNHLNSVNANFCGKCGSVISHHISTMDYTKNVKRISIFFFVLLGYIASIHFIELEQNYLYILLIDILFALIISLFCWIDITSLKSSLRFKQLNKKWLIYIAVGAPLFAVLISLLADTLNQQIFDESQIAYYNAFSDSPSPILFSILSIGLFPAIFEEIAFRGVFFTELQKITNLKSTIVISAILFSILHLSLLSLIWIFPLGLLFGYLRAKYRTIWYGVIGHFIYNSTIVLIEVISQ